MTTQEGDGEEGSDTGQRPDPPELPAALRQALGHPVRRQILRVLNASPKARSATDLAAASLPERTIGAVSYHARVLEACGGLRQMGFEEVPGNVRRLYASAVAEHEGVASVLRETSASDAAG